MKRREFLKTTAATTALATLGGASQNVLPGTGSDDVSEAACCDRTHATVQAAMQASPETIAYIPTIYAGTGVQKPDYLATIDVDPKSPAYGTVIHRLPMPNIGDELHHFGWNACSSCHGEEGAGRRFIVLPGISSGRIHIVDTQDPRQPKLHKVIEPETVKAKTGLSAPHTVHCLADGTVLISMLGDSNGDAPGGFMMMDSEFNILGRWEKDSTGMNFNYDYWYQPRHNVMISSEWAAPNTVSQGFKLEDVQAGKYGRHLHFWNWKERTIEQSIDLGENGLIPLEVRFHHNPDSTHGFVGAALSSTIWHWEKRDGKWAADNVIGVESIETEGWPFAVPGLITDLVLSLDDRFLYFSNWLHGDLRQYDVSDPTNPKLTGQVWLGGVIGKTASVKGQKLSGGPQMLQLSLDGKRLYVTNSLYSPWDNQFYPAMAKEGSYLLQLDCNTESGGLSLNENFMIDFGKEPGGAARAHEIRFPNGDCTSDIWV
ncbi:MAG: selenium-binding family protein [Mariniblastus sp.]|nr:selenium-binding family protein [Mariniblastus sp.]